MRKAFEYSGKGPSYYFFHPIHLGLLFVLICIGTALSIEKLDKDTVIFGDWFTAAPAATHVADDFLVGRWRPEEAGTRFSQIDFLADGRVLLTRDDASATGQADPFRGYWKLRRLSSNRFELTVVHDKGVRRRSFEVLADGRIREDHDGRIFARQTD